MASGFLLPCDKLLTLLKGAVMSVKLHFLFLLPNPIYDTGRQSHTWSHSLGPWDTRNGFSLSNPAGLILGLCGFFVFCLGFLCVFVCFIFYFIFNLVCPLPFYTWTMFIMMQHRHNFSWDGAVHGSFIWLLYEELLCLNEFTMLHF